MKLMITVIMKVIGKSHRSMIPLSITNPWENIGWGQDDKTKILKISQREKMNLRGIYVTQHYFLMISITRLSSANSDWGWLVRAIMMNYIICTCQDRKLWTLVIGDEWQVINEEKVQRIIGFRITIFYRLAKEIDYEYQQENPSIKCKKECGWKFYK